MEIADILKPERINLDLKSHTKEGALKELTHLLYETGSISDEDAFLKDVIAREEISTTGVGNGVAIPHGKSNVVKETSAVIGRVKSGSVEWETFDDKPVTFIVLLAVDEADKTGVHVRLLSSMARKLASEKTCAELTSAETADEIVSIFSK